MGLQYLLYQQIDKSKWDACIEAAPNGLIYARSWWLDTMADNWDALILGDYETVMPLTWKRKWGIRYLYQPAFISQLGLISERVVDENITQMFINAIPSSMKYCHVAFNEANKLTAFKNLQITERTNFVLPLSKSYNDLFKNYNNDAQKNLRRAEKFNLEIKENISPEKVVEMYIAAYGKLNPSLKQKHYDTFAKLMNKAIEKQMGFTIAIADEEGGLHASAFMGKDNKRIYYLLGAPSEEGRNTKAVHALIDAVIQKYASSDLSLDFEGSNIASVATFYKKFNPQRKTYSSVVINNLPWPISLLKK